MDTTKKIELTNTRHVIGLMEKRIATLKKLGVEYLNMGHPDTGKEYLSRADELNTMKLNLEMATSLDEMSVWAESVKV